MTTSEQSSEVRVGYLTTLFPEFKSTIGAAPYFAGKHLGREGQIVVAPFDHHRPDDFDLVLCIGVSAPESRQKLCVDIDPEEMLALNEFERVELVAGRIAAGICRLGSESL